MIRIWLVWLLAASYFIRLQVPGLVEITSPFAGEVIDGLATIRGTADHPLFLNYDLSFSLDPDPLDTWFNIGEPVETRVIDDRLGIWDTTGISDGSYRLRLRVHTEDGGSISTVVEGLQVRNYSPFEAAEEPEPIAAVQVSPTPLPTSENVAAVATPQAPGQSANPLWLGAITGGGLLLALGAYVRLRRALRAQGARLKARQIQRRTKRERRA
jgi:hypothetical protein